MRATGDEQPLYSSTFAPLLRPKAMLIWSWHQVLVGAAVLSIFMVRTAFGAADVVSPVNLVLAVLLAVDLVNVHDLSLWQIGGLKLGLLLRQATGASRATYSPLTAGSTVGLVDVPGDEGESIQTYRVVNTGAFDGACLIWDSVRNEATAPILLRATGSQLADTKTRNAHAKAFSRALHSMAAKDDISRVTIQARALLRPTTGTAGLDGPAGEDIRELEDGALDYTMGHDYLLGITINPTGDAGSTISGFIHNKLRGQNKISVTEACGQLADRVTGLCAMLPECGVDGSAITWLNADQLRGLEKTLTDPEAHRLLDPHGNLPADIPVQTSWREYSDHVSVGPSCARTFWISSWAETDPVGSDWLAAVNRSPGMQLVFTQVFRHRTKQEAKDQLDRQGNESGLISKAIARFGIPENEDNERAKRTMAMMKKENSKNNGDVQFQGFVTILARDTEQLELDDKTVNALAESHSMYLDRMRDQQMARWIGALPFGLEGRE